MSEASFKWQESLTQTFQELVTQILEIAPLLLGAVMLLIVGWFIANLFRLGTKKLIDGLDTLFKRAVRADTEKHEKLKRSYAAIVSKFVFWVVMLFFIASAGNLLGWDMFTGWVGSVINYLPNIITGLLIILAGVLLGNGVKSALITTANAAGIEHSEILGRSIQLLIILTSVVIGFGQLGINVELISNVLVIIVGVVLAGGALAFGLGAKTLIANVIGAQYVRKHCRLGEEMTLGEVTGIVAEVTRTSIVLDTNTGRAVIPAKAFQENITHFCTVDGNAKNT